MNRLKSKEGQPGDLRFGHCEHEDAADREKIGMDCSDRERQGYSAMGARKSAFILLSTLDTLDVLDIASHPGYVLPPSTPATTLVGQNSRLLFRDRPILIHPDIGY